MNYNGILELVSLLIINTPIKQKQFIKQLRYVLAHTAKKENPDMTVSDIASITGLLRGTVSDFLDEMPPKTEESKESAILNSLWKKKDEDHLIPIHGENSFYDVCDVIKIGYSPDVALNRLIKDGCIEYSQGKIKILKSKISLDTYNKGLIRLLNKNALLLTRTIFHNMHNDDKMFQSSMKSSSIHPRNIKSAHDEVFKFIKEEVMPVIREILEKYEDKNKFNYPEYVISIFENFLKLKR